MTIELPSDYQKFIHASRYARFRDDLGRRENWNETVDRYVDHFASDLEERHNYKPSQLILSEVTDAILNLHVMPSMRALMTAGPALKRENIAGYNCSYIAMSNIHSFSEVLYVLMCGTGVGFSVERQFINKLPKVPDTFNKIPRVIVVKDSKRGWAQGYAELIECLYQGVVPEIDVSEVRAAGERLMTFGGRASGPEPLLRLFEFATKKFVEAAGRRLNSDEIHEIVCMTGDIVVVGGVRRAALISLSNLSDLRMRHIKSGEWWKTHAHLQLANNSAAYTEMPEVQTFMEEWLALYTSKSGERGIFNREGAIEKIESIGRRDPNYDFGVNPCGEIILRPDGLCNLSEAVIRENDTFNSLREKVRIASIIGTWQATQTSFKFVNDNWRKNAEEERLLGVSLTGVFDNSVMRGDKGLDHLASDLRKLKSEVIKANVRESKLIGVQPSVATTTIKPSGTVSQLVLSPSGIHTGHSPFYIRRVSQDNKDPVTQFLKEAGFPNEPHDSQPDAMTVFSFPVALGKHTMTRDQISSLEHMELVKCYGQNWSEHAVSCTISVRENEWPSVGGWVYDNFKHIVGMSFLPHFESSSVYRQLPYETITESEYREKVKGIPEIDWAELARFEAGEDKVTGTREFACVGNMCEIVEASQPA